MPVLGAYTLSHRLGAGGMGEVWRAAGPYGPVAIKILTQPTTQTELFRTCFQHEVQAMARLYHPAVVAIYDQGVVSDQGVGSQPPFPLGAPYLVMDLLTGGSVAEALPRLDWPAVRALLHRILPGLAHAHARGLLHRDLKPQNLLLRERDAWDTVQIADFGLSHPIEAEVAGLPPSAGTPQFMAPEQFRGEWRHFGPPTDLYGLGCLVWMLVVGLPPFHYATSAAVRRAQEQAALPRFKPRFKVPAGLLPWLERLLEKDPADRLPDAPTALAALDAIEGKRSPKVFPSAWQGEAVRARPVGLGVLGFRALPMVGREAERDRLWEMLGGRLPQAVVIEGPSGTGKSRLAEWLVERAAELGVASGLRALHGPLPGPGQGLAGMLARRLKTSGLSGPALETELSWLPEHERRAVAELIEPSGRVRFGSGREQRWVVQRALTSLGGRLVIWLDDAQWGSESLDFVEEVLKDGTLSALLVLTVETSALAERPAERERLAKLLSRPDVSRLSLGPLSAQDGRALVEEQLGLAPELAERITTRTAGNPLFVVQLIADWVERGVLEPSSEGFHCRGGADERLPDSLHLVWSTRLSRILQGISPSARAGLEIAALLGTRVDGAEWRAACQGARVTADPGIIEVLRHHDLVICGPQGVAAGFRFAHPMLRESIERQSQRAGRARGLHAVCAATVRAPARRAHHLIAAGEPSAALLPLSEAIQSHIERGDLDEAEHLLGLYTELAGALPEADPRRAPLYLLTARIARQRSDHNAARVHAENGAAEARQQGWDAPLVRLINETADLDRLRGRFSDALTRLYEAERLARELGDNALLGAVLQRIGTCEVERGRPAEGAVVAAAAHACFVAAGEEVSALTALNLQGMACWGAGDTAGAQAAWEATWDAATALGCRWVAADAANNLGYLLLRTGNPDDALVRFNQAVGLWQAQGRDGLVGRFNIAVVHAERGRFAEAEPLLHDIAARWQRLGWGPAWEVQALAPLCWCLAFRRDWAAFDAVYARLVALSAELEHVEPDVTRHLGEALTLAAARAPE